MRVTLNWLRKRLTGLFAGAGLGAQDTAVLVDILLDAEASGRRTHGLIRVRPMLKHLATSGHQPGRWLKEEAACALYDGQGGLGYLVTYACTLKVMELLERSPLAVVGARGATHTGPIGYFAGQCARQGLVTFFFTNCSPFAAPYGAREAILGTNPITIGLPGDPEPVVVDLATTATTYGECRVALEEGRSLPEGVALDSRGAPTTDPAEAIHGGALLPFGGHKGYALALAIQVLTTALTGASAIPGAGEDYGLSIIALRKDLLVGGESYDRITAEVLRAVKAARPLDQSKPVLIPGERSAGLRRQALESGIEIEPQLYEKLFGKAEEAQ
ncbi:MAG: hypothetical protein A3F83_06795 [Candidatus Glassbacteria bacterium RIFCSPLOWO2_12_FULL_58_11]|uniref:Lactate dehydrogenase n=1 Tax=Candidatus Glassbacteria bacterium RIFCSPLOWO2_12_FULL_58_11 TaxID=1817867 RepID=A0A1F5Z2N6_9BACT|nr:MAG: hypothetical protein A3F83_06795 [Candidatus Glassbacteria bacterium RIFCSPLOWO2_12_FULL_58_11]